jgi:hypothetical protein
MGIGAVTFTTGAGTFQEQYTENVVAGNMAQADMAINGVVDNSNVTIAYTNSIGLVTVGPITFSDVFPTFFIGPSCSDFHCAIDDFDGSFLSIRSSTDINPTKLSFDGVIEVVPEPSSIALLGVAVGLLGYALRRSPHPLG